jgi:hypothetical protein
MEKNQRAHMNCVVEKRRSEELVDHAPRSVQLPFGLNLTTAPRLEHLTGERMVISCESGQKQERSVARRKKQNLHYINIINYTN